MQVASKTHRLARVLRNPSAICLNSERVNSTSSETSHLISPLCRSYHSSISPSGIYKLYTQFKSKISGTIFGNTVQIEESLNESNLIQSSVAKEAENSASESVKKLYEKIHNSITEKKSAPPNAWLWSMIEKCANNDDIKLMFKILKKLRVFSLSNHQIHYISNSALCQNITKACIRVGAIDYGKKVLWKHNVYGLEPTIESAHLLLSHAKQHKDAKLMKDIMKLMKTNKLPLQPWVANIVLNICYETDNWMLFLKYSIRFHKARVNLSRNYFGLWMKFAAKRGDIDCLWEIEEIRSIFMKQHTLATGFSCAKGFLLERKSKEAAKIIKELNKNLLEAEKLYFIVELQELVSEWTLEVIKNQKEYQKELVDNLQEDIPAMIKHLSRMGIKPNLNLENLTNLKALCCQS